MTQAVLVLAGVVATAVFGLLGTIVTAKSNREAASGPDWQGFTDRIMRAQEEQLQERDKRIGALETKVEGMRAALSTLERKYHHSIEHIRAWRRTFPDGGPPVPPAIEDDLL